MGRAPVKLGGHDNHHFGTRAFVARLRRRGPCEARAERRRPS
ncbi:hypothetical protein GLE_2955 [Lysobacter enzymogenes]|uniref:Uncharacterized protein n=1 Tax=Lysobacter enzymogenes TaxID=69 RepID=A0A0S2DJ67_LYSEN|nr:hypothetical protein GLE_2955 [Lysobacter enzymogenes]